MFSLIRKRKYTKKNARKSTVRPVTTVTSRPVMHERWVHKDQLEIGMYVAELSVPWEDTSFMFQGFEIDSVRLLKQVRDESEYVLVRTEKVANLSSNSTDRLCHAKRSTGSTRLNDNGMSVARSATH